MTDGLNGISDPLLTRPSWSYRLSWTIETLLMRRMLKLGHRITSSDREMRVGGAICDDVADGGDFEPSLGLYMQKCRTWARVATSYKLFILLFQFSNTGSWTPSQPFCCCI